MEERTRLHVAAWLHTLTGISPPNGAAASYAQSQRSVVHFVDGPHRLF
jgi:hypothetical protein